MTNAMTLGLASVAVAVINGLMNLLTLKAARRTETKTAESAKQLEVNSDKLEEVHKATNGMSKKLEEAADKAGFARGRQVTKKERSKL